MMFLKSEHGDLYNPEYVRKIGIEKNYLGSGEPDGYSIVANREKIITYRDCSDEEARRKAEQAMKGLEYAIEGNYGGGNAVFEFPG